jgi:hypothetical protein
MSRSFDADFDRIILADVYPRKEDPFKPRPAITPASAPAASMLTPEQLAAQGGAAPNPFQLLLTQPGQRPVVYQRANNFAMTVTTTPQPLQAQQYQCDAILIDVASALTTSIFFGFGSSITTASGIEVQPGLPVQIKPDNTREQWEVQRLLEMIAAMLADQGGYNILGQYKAPRVVLDASQWYVVCATATVAISVCLFNVPEQQ